MVAMAAARDAPLTDVCSALDDAQAEEVSAAFKDLGIVTEITPLGEDAKMFWFLNF